MNLFKTLGRRTATVFAATFMLLGCLHLQAQTPKEWKQLKGDVTLYMANDLGRNGYYDQKPIAELMGHMAETTGMECRYFFRTFNTNYRLNVFLKHL